MKKEIMNEVDCGVVYGGMCMDQREWINAVIII